MCKESKQFNLCIYSFSNRLPQAENKISGNNVGNEMNVDTHSYAQQITNTL